MKNIFKNKIILITGASGTIGSDIVLKILKLQNFKVVRAMSNDENGLHELLENIDVNLTSFNLSDNTVTPKANKLEVESLLSFVKGNPDGFTISIDGKATPKSGFVLKA